MVSAMLPLMISAAKGRACIKLKLNEGTITMNHNNRNNRRSIVRAVAMAVAVMSAPTAYAACTTGSAPATDANTVTCTEGSTYTNAAGSTVSNTATISTGGATSSAVQMVGNGSKFTNSGVLTNDSVYTNTGSNSGQKFGAYIAAPTATTDVANTITNKGTISATISDANMQTNKARLNTVAVVGVGTDAEAEYRLTNSGTISATHNGVGRVNGVEAGGDVESMTIINSGTITGTQSHAITKTTSTATSFQGTVTLGDSSTTSAASIGVAAGIYAEEEVQEMEVENTGTINGVGSYASGIYTRAAESTITNEGTIQGSKIGVAQVSDSGEIRHMKMENSGTITGDVLSVNGAAMRWLSLSNGEGTGGATINSRLNINSQWGQADSEITNSGTITGNFYYSNGTHELHNKEGATITGNIDLDQRDTTCSSCNTPAVGANTTGGTLGVASNWTVVGTKSFTFENAGDFDGNLTIRTASSTALGGPSPVASSVTLIPTVTGSGAGSSLAAPSHNIAGMGDTLTIDATAGAGEVTVAPKSLVTVHQGEYFLVADTLTLTGGATAPGISSVNTPLVTWSIDTSGGNVVIAVDSVKSASSVAGVSTGSAAVLDALLQGNTSLGGAVQGLTSAADIEKAGQQLRPEINNASMMAALGITSQVQSVVDNRVADVHLAQADMTGIATGESAPDKGFWVQGFGFHGNQDTLDGVDGYTASSGGAAFGADMLINPNVRAGAAFSYARTTIDAEGVNAGSNTNMDSYQGMVYGSYLGDGWYLNGNVGIGLHKYDTARLITVPVTDTAKGSHDGWQYSFKVDGGYPIKTGAVTFIPSASIAYSHLKQDGYTESSNAGTALTVGGSDTDSFKTGLGGKALVTLANTSSIATLLEGRAMWFHEFGDTSTDTTASFASGGGSFTSNGVSIDRESFNVGASLKFSSKTEAQSLTVSYDAQIRDEYVGHTGMVQARFDF